MSAVITGLDLLSFINSLLLLVFLSELYEQTQGEKWTPKGHMGSDMCGVRSYSAARPQPQDHVRKSDCCWDLANWPCSLLV